MSLFGTRSIESPSEKISPETPEVVAQETTGSSPVIEPDSSVSSGDSFIDGNEQKIQNQTTGASQPQSNTPDTVTTSDGIMTADQVMKRGMEVLTLEDGRQVAIKPDERLTLSGEIIPESAYLKTPEDKELYEALKAKCGGNKNAQRVLSEFCDDVFGADFVSDQKQKEKYIKLAEKFRSILQQLQGGQLSKGDLSNIVKQMDAKMKAHAATTVKPKEDGTGCLVESGKFDTEGYLNDLIGIEIGHESFLRGILKKV